ncbi:hypothetical protein TWF281_002271 [Arthrobotrys megalospora]
MKFTLIATLGLHLLAGTVLSRPLPNPLAQNARLAEIAEAFSKIAADTAAGMGQTVSQVPGAVLQTVHAIDTNKGLAGDVVRTITGGRK